ncbi:disease resistance protein RGA2-like isoform X1 [Tripterygium wilfordii]|uniref:disease resistance protein RGA2-like isoform X1 n=1 Tax=Tripterygium wilfordii TaxID=458696 RepID=UPI0018F7EAFA|nr:disease resistance protein RGA2-like isoform X1 [Tripterygium wilfordii]XP_038697446.1 disease resistance protein RGA2-like isoform X1 [Tripterygium wilfordii]XP_038697447.1 disease resistance protein RGA2-like isoform X1 [Tripterygium wilfordii]XP_038697448.1 disease resistance protein RGA2-like isoform X1 [Tripterygium wilfordii]
MDFLRRLKEIINLPRDDVMSSPQWFSQNVLPHETLRLDSSHLEVEVNKMEITNLPPDDVMSSPQWFSQNVLPHENLRLDSSDMVVEVNKTNLLRRLEEITNLPRDDIMSSLQWFSQNVLPLQNCWWVTLVLRLFASRMPFEDNPGPLILFQKNSPQHQSVKEALEWFAKKLQLCKEDSPECRDVTAVLRYFVHQLGLYKDDNPNCCQIKVSKMGRAVFEAMTKNKSRNALEREYLHYWSSHVIESKQSSPVVESDSTDSDVPSWTVLIPHVNGRALPYDGFQWSDTNFYLHKCDVDSCSAMKHVYWCHEPNLTILYEGAHYHKPLFDLPDEIEISDPLESMKRYICHFPAEYKFHKSTLIQLWIAEGFIKEDLNGRMEDTGSVHFDCLLKEKFIVCAQRDPRFLDGNTYKVNTAKIGESLLLNDDKLECISEDIKTMSLLYKDINHVFESLKKFKSLSTLLLFPRPGICIKPLTDAILMRSLNVLKLSDSGISELPGSIGCLESLRYLDASNTTIGGLPSTICQLQYLQTLKLKDCLNIYYLPRDLKKLISLRHLDLDVAHMLKRLPAGVGCLTNLQTLPAFVLDQFGECRIGELKHLNNLSGEFRILQLEYVVNADEAKESALCEKRYLDKLELQWSYYHKNVDKEEEILECLQPHYNLKELSICSYLGSHLPSWIGNPLFKDLVGINLDACTNCQFLPSIGVLPSLKVLCIWKMDCVKQISESFFRNSTYPTGVSFPNLNMLMLDDMPSLEKWTGMEIGDLPSLRELRIDSCPELVTLPCLSSLKSLENLQLIDCPKLSPFVGELPMSMKELYVDGSPLIEQQCNSESGKDWQKVVHVPSLYMGGQWISTGMGEIFSTQNLQGSPLPSGTATQSSIQASTTI